MKGGEGDGVEGDGREGEGKVRVDEGVPFYGSYRYAPGVA